MPCCILPARPQVLAEQQLINVAQAQLEAEIASNSAADDTPPGNGDRDRVILISSSRHLIRTVTRPDNAPIVDYLLRAAKCVAPELIVPENA